MKRDDRRVDVIKKYIEGIRGDLKKLPALEANVMTMQNVSQMMKMLGGLIADRQKTSLVMTEEHAATTDFGNAIGGVDRSQALGL